MATESKISVCIRVRPLSAKEKSSGSGAWSVEDKRISQCNHVGVPAQGQSYAFDHVFRGEQSTLDLYVIHTKDIIASTVNGFNGTIFAYGQTSSGKTHTMRGTPEEPGIIPLAVQEIFQRMRQCTDREFLLRVSYMEIYNEDINDLLAPESKKLQIHENIERGIFVAGLCEEIVDSPDQVMALMEVGQGHRHVGETNMNADSSRSHTIFRMVLESRDKSCDEESRQGEQVLESVRVSTLHLVDLAGSERVSKTGAEGARRKEGGHINKSLMTLGNVIHKLSDGAEHVPYRDSKLTRILQPALGGNAKTAIICCVTPAGVHADETRGTLQFASRAKKVTNQVCVNEITNDDALLKRQKKEIEELRLRLEKNHSPYLEQELLNLRNALLRVELEKESMVVEQAERERQIRHQEQKIASLSSMVVSQAVDDRDKRGSRRETWAPPRVAHPRANFFPLVEEAEEASPPTPPTKVARREEQVTMQLRSLEAENERLKERLVEEGRQKEKLEAEVEFLELAQAEGGGGAAAERRAKSLGGGVTSALADLKERVRMLGVEKALMQQEVDDVAEQASRDQREVQEMQAEARGERERRREVEERLEEAGRDKQELANKVAETMAALARAGVESSAAAMQCKGEEVEEEVKAMRAQVCQLQLRLTEQQEQVTEVEEKAREAMERLRVEREERVAVTAELQAEKRRAEEEQGEMAARLIDLQAVVEDAQAMERHCAEVTREVMATEAQRTILSERVTEVEAQLASEQAVAAEALQRVEASRQESSGLRVELVGLRKEVQSAKGAPAGLEKERDAVGRELEKTKAKLKDTDAKLKTALREKSAAQGERAKMDQELRRLRGQSNQLSRRESVAERRRESMAAGLSKAKGQAVSTEQQLNHKAAEMEKMQFEMEVLQNAFERMQSSARAAEESRAELQAKVEEAEGVVGAALRERDEVIGMVEEGQGHMRDVEEQLRGLREEHTAMVGATATLHHSLLLATQQTSRMEAVEEELAAVRGQLTESFLEFESQRAVWAAESRAEQDRMQKCVAEERALKQELASRLSAVETSMARERMAAEEERVKAVSVLEGRVEMLSEQLEEVQEQEKADRVLLHLTDESREIEREDELRLLRNRLEKAERQVVMARLRKQEQPKPQQDVSKLKAQLEQLESRRVRETVALSKELNATREEMAELIAGLQRVPLGDRQATPAAQGNKRVPTPRGDRGCNWITPKSGTRVDVLQDP